MSRTMKAAVFEGNGVFGIKELPLDEFEEGIRLLREKKALKVVIYPY